MARPTTPPLDWATASGSLVVAPSASLTSSGWVPSQRLPAQTANYIFRQQGLWAQYLSSSELEISSSFWPLSATVAGMSSSFSSTLVQGTVGSFSSLTGTVATGSTATFVSGVFDFISASNLTSSLPDTASFSELTGTTTTGSAATFVSGVFDYVSASNLVFSLPATASFSELTGTVTTGTTALFAEITGSTSGALVQATSASFLSLTASVLPTSGAAVRTLSDVAYGALSYEVIFSISGVPSGTLARIVLARSVTVPIDASGSIGSVGTNPATASIFTIDRNGFPVITASIDTTGTVTFANTASIAFVRGDIVTLAYTGSDPSLSDLSITLVGTL